MDRIIITGYPYALPYYFKVFEYAENKDGLIFILPSFWQAKEGKVKVKLEKKSGFKIYGLPVVSYGGKSLWRGLFKGWMPGIVFILLSAKWKHGGKVLYSCSEPNLLTTLYNGFWAKFLGYKHILFTWQNVPPEERLSGWKLSFSNRLVKLNLALADGVICGNQKAEEIVRSFDKKIRTLVCPLSGVDIEKFKPADQPKTPKNKIILFYGALEKRKGVEFLMQAFSRLSFPEAELLIIGTGPEKEKLQNMAEELGIKEKVIFQDWMKNEELPEVLKNSAVFVYPSVPSGGWEEQFGYAMAEASASGVPVVATKTGSIGEVVKNGETGILVFPGQIEELKNALEKLLTDNGLGEKMGLAGRDLVLKNFSHPIVAGKIFGFLNQFL